MYLLQKKKKISNFPIIVVNRKTKESNRFKLGFKLLNLVRYTPIIHLYLF